MMFTFKAVGGSSWRIHQCTTMYSGFQLVVARDATTLQGRAHAAQPLLCALQYEPTRETDLIVTFPAFEQKLVRTRLIVAEEDAVGD